MNYLKKKSMLFNSLKHHCTSSLNACEIVEDFVAAIMEEVDYIQCEETSGELCVLDWPVFKRPFLKEQKNILKLLEELLEETKNKIPLHSYKGLLTKIEYYRIKWC